MKCEVTNVPSPEENDPEFMQFSGATHITAELAQHYGVKDIDGKVIPSLRATRGEPIWSAA